MADEVLDLDALIPPDRKIKIGGREFIVHPLTIQQLLVVTRLETDLTKIKSEDEVMPLIKNAMTPFIPDLEKDDTIQFTAYQLRELIKFAIKISSASVDTEAKKYDNPKKKIASQEESPTSSDSTKDTPSKKS